MPPATATAAAAASSQRQSSSAEHPSDIDILANGLRNGARAFVLGMSIRGGLLLLLKLVAVVRRRISLRDALVRSFGSDALRFASFFASYAAIWKTSNSLLVKYRRGKDDKLNGFISGSLAGISLLAETKHMRIALAYQLIVRGIQGTYNSLKKRGHFHLPHGDSLLFALCTAQIMYAYAIRPDTIPASYYAFIKNTGPISEPVLKLVRNHLYHRVPLRTEDVVDAVVRQDATHAALEVAKALDPFPAIIPCEVMHPSNPNCDSHFLWTAKNVLQSIVPVYLSLNIVPAVTLHTKKLLSSPLRLLARAILNTGRSSLFLALFCASYMRLACVVRDLVARGILKGDHRYVYWVIGFISSASIFVEDKRRRSELAMYVAPRGIDSLYQVMYNRRWMIHIPYFEVFMFSVGMGLITAFFQTEPDALSSVLCGLLRRANATIEDPGAPSLVRLEARWKELEDARRREAAAAAAAGRLNE